MMTKRYQRWSSDASAKHKIYLLCIALSVAQRNGKHPLREYCAEVVEQFEGEAAGM